MVKRQIGIVRDIFRYPVKSMLGERLQEAEIGALGLDGDRAWAVREANGRVVTAKKWPNMFEFRAAYDSPPIGDALPSLSITSPDGRFIQANDPEASALLSAAMGRPVTLARAQSGQRNSMEIDPATLFADLSVEEILPDAPAGLITDAFELRAGRFFDAASLHLLASGTLEHLHKLAGGFSQFEPQRFRPNIVIETPPGETGFMEDGWLEGIIAIGDSVRIAKLEPTLRCAMTTHGQGKLPRDTRVLRTAAQHHRANVGVFAFVEAQGKVRVGDPVLLME